MRLQPKKFPGSVSILVWVILLLAVSGTVSSVFAAGVTINQNKPVTNIEQVLLDYTPAPGATQVSFRNADDATALWSAWEDIPGTPVKQWTLSNASGQKTVEARYRTSALATTIMPGKYSGSILLDYSLDTTFSPDLGYINNGVAGGTTTTARAVAVDSQGRKVVVGTVDMANGSSRMIVIQYAPDGAVNWSYAYGNLNVATSKTVGNGVAIGAGDSIYAVGSYDQDGAGNTDIIVLKLTSGGAGDPNFKGNPGAQGGSVVYESPGTDSGNAIAIDGNQRIVVVGTYDDTPNGFDNYGRQAIVMRLNSTGEFDTTFGTPLIDPVTTGMFMYGGPGNDAGNAVAIDAAGRIVVAGTYEHTVGDTSAWLFRIDPVLDPFSGLQSGQLDLTFNGSGDIAYGDAGADRANAVAVIPVGQGGGLLVAGVYDWTGGDTDAGVLRLLDDGSLNTSFFGSGSRTFGGIGPDSANALAILGGNVIVAGSYDEGGKTSLWATSLLLSDGSTDPDFNRGQEYFFGSYGNEAGNGVAFQSDGRIIISGTGHQIDGVKNLPSSLLTLRLLNTITTFALTVNTTGSGTVALFPVGGSYAAGTVVQLTPTATGGATFSNWTGCDTVAGDVCTVTITADKTVSAVFTAASQSFSVNVAVGGTGSVTVCAGVACATGNNTCSGPTCSYSYLYGTPLSFSTTNAWYTTFAGWSGACTGVGACEPTLTGTLNLSAAFFEQQNIKLSTALTYYPTLLKAYGAISAAGSATYAFKEMQFPEGPLTLDRSVTMTINGGKDTAFADQAGRYSTFVGRLNVSAGKLIPNYLKIKP